METSRTRPVFERAREQYLISTDPHRLDPEAIHAYLTQSYWASGIPRQIVEQSLEGSLCFGLYDGGRQVGLARVVTDGATFGYVCDVYVLESHRGRGLGTWLMRSVMAHPDLARLRRLVLVTRDAHGLYAKCGFRDLASPRNYMELTRPDIYRDAEATIG